MSETTDEKVKRVLEEMIEMFGKSLPNAIHEPMRFRYYIKLYNYQKSISNA